MKEIRLPYIQDLEKSDFKSLEATMELGATKVAIQTVCWPDAFPYAPSAQVAIARSGTHIVLSYRVCGLDLRAEAMEDNGPVWEDSCCEFFVGHPTDGSYFNFEMNCIGTLLAAKRRSRDDFRFFSPEQLGRIIRHSSLERRKYDINGELFSWRTAICIPFDLIGIDPQNLPEYLRANIYKCADRSAHPHFLSWNPVETPTPDFHRPEYFGKILL